MLEITALSCQHISVSFEHPLQESMSTIEIDLSDAGSVSAKLYSTSTDANSKTSSEHVSKILQRQALFSSPFFKPLLFFFLTPSSF